MAIRSEADQLLVFCRVVRLGSFTRAAEELCLTQPAVSATVAKLERRLKARLIDRVGRRMCPTEAGKALFACEEQVEQLCRLISQAEQTVADASESLGGRVTIGANDTLGVYVLPPLLGRFKRQHPKVEIALTVGGRQSLVDGLASGMFDFCLVGMPTRTSGVDFERLMRDELFLFVASDHLWAGQGAEGVGLENLAAEPFISHRIGAGTQRAIAEEFKRHGIDIVPSMTIENLEALKNLVVAGLGVSILSRLVTRREVQSGALVRVPVRDAVFTREFYLATLRGRHTSRTARAFLAFLKEQLPLLD